MKQDSILSKRLWELRDLLRSCALDGVTEIAAALFFLKRLTDLGNEGRLNELPFRQTPRLVRILGSFSWASAGSGHAISTLTSLIRDVEAEIPHLKGLSTHSRLAHALAVGQSNEITFADACRQIVGVWTSRMPAMEVAEAFQQLLDSMSEHAPSATTPRSVRKLLVELVSPSARDVIYDPVCGYASLLCEAAIYAGGRGTFPHVAGQDTNLGTLVLGQMAVILHGICSDLRFGNTLTEPKHLDGSSLSRFDVVIANPPFGQKIDPNAVSSQLRRPGSEPPTTSELAFLELALASLNSEGRAAILVPQGMLFREGQHRMLRENLVREGRIAAVIALPRQIFANTVIQVAVLLLRGANVSQPKSSVVFVDLSRFSEGAKIRHLTDQGIKVAGKAITSKINEPGVSAQAAFEEIVHNDFNLSIQRYVRPTEEESPNFGECLDLFRSSVQKRDQVEREAIRLVTALSGRKRVREREDAT